LIKLSIVIITWNQWKKLEKCLQSIFNNEFITNKSKYEIIIIDNNSNDKTGLVINKFKSKIIYIRNNKNYGVAPARNQGITIAKGKYILMLDDDTEVIKGCFYNIIKFMDTHQDCWGAGTKQLHPDGSLEYNARTFYNIPVIIARRSPVGKFMKKTIKKHLMMDWDHNSSREVDWVAGASFIMRKEAINKIGVFDDRYFFGFEDVDWCYRVKLAKKKIYYIHTAQIIHYVQGSSRKLITRKAFYHLLSAIRFFIKFKLKNNMNKRFWSL